MSARQRHHRFALALGIVATAAIAACDVKPTEPSVPLSRVQLKFPAIEGDTLQCLYGWVVVQGHYACNDQ